MPENVYSVQFLFVCYLSSPCYYATYMYRFTYNPDRITPETRAREDFQQSFHSTSYVLLFAKRSFEVFLLQSILQTKLTLRRSRKDLLQYVQNNVMIICFIILEYIYTFLFYIIPTLINGVLRTFLLICTISINNKISVTRNYLNISY